ncbi:hypothetical protein BN1723_003811 [Verticillium longisporum]|uniref:Inositol-1-monophosphatase n=1 Tax=Verticillium longisporum TaxID=100787 RepID=A0A0G4MCX2_VERLO|nr:hypothetical protein BN1723_003811 [Verticillium longisporum]
MADMSDAELHDIYDFAVQLGKDAGDLLMKFAMARFTGGAVGEQAFEEKDNAVDIVTKVDQDMEAFIRSSIEKKYPSHAFLGEESYSAGASRDYLVTAAPTWIIDPLDGTVNFTHLVPLFCVSIGFALHGRPVIGVINAPFLHQLFTACRGRGAWLNHTQPLPLLRDPGVPPLPAAAPKGCIFACEWGKDRRDVPNGNCTARSRALSTWPPRLAAATARAPWSTACGVLGVRRSIWPIPPWAHSTFGGKVDAGSGECFLTTSPISSDRYRDVAAGIAILEEAGGLVTTANPPDDAATVDIPEAKLGGRLYLAIRPAGPSDTETGRQGQERVVREVWRRVRELDYARPGVESK